MQASSILLKRAMFALSAGRIELGSYRLIFKFYRLRLKISVNERNIHDHDGKSA